MTKLGTKIKSTIVISALLFGTVGIVSASDTSAAPDNTAVNARDRDSGARTAGEQSNNQGDVKLAADIRKAVVADDSLSMLAKNVKIITNDGMVTLRGPVNTPDEKAAIDAKAKSVAGADKVSDQLEVKQQ
jgi:hyperosmotically inducible protein